MIRIIICLLISIAVGWAAYGDLAAFDESSFKDVLNVLLNVSSIIFAIIGAWIAIIYPTAIKQEKLPKGEKGVSIINESTLDANYLSELFQTVLFSAFVIISVVVVQVAMPLLKAYKYFGFDLSLLKSIAVGYMLFMAFIQLSSISVVVQKNFGMLNRVRKKLREDTFNNDI